MLVYVGWFFSVDFFANIVSCFHIFFFLIQCLHTIFVWTIYHLHSPNITSSRPSNTSSQGARFDFLYGPEDWGFLPYWAHVVPIFIAQFHTLLCIIFLCNGLPYVLGFCQETWSGICGDVVTWLFFWGVDAHPERGKLGPMFKENPQNGEDLAWDDLLHLVFFSFFL